MPKPTLCIPAEPDAAALYNKYWNDQVKLPEDVQNVLLVALSAVGRAKWDQAHGNLGKAREGVFDWTSGVNCWTTVVKFAVIGGGLNEGQMQKFVQALDSAAGAAGGVQVRAVELLYTKIPHTTWTSGANVPLGAMVYHGRSDVGGNTGNPISHVTIHVGENKVVGCWAAAYTESDALKQKFLSLTDRGWAGDTMITPIDAFGTGMLAYSTKPFWFSWPL